MQLTNRWRSWNPTETPVNYAEAEVSKVAKASFDTFDTPIAAQSQNFSSFGASVPVDEPDAWRVEYEKWMRKACVFDEGSAGSVACLNRSFADWCIAGNAVCPCTAETFARLLAQDGFEIGEGMIARLVLTEDHRAARLAAPSASGSTGGPERGKPAR